MSVQVITPDVDAGSLLAGAQFVDAYTLIVEDTTLDARGAAERIFNTLPRWISGLMAPSAIALSRRSASRRRFRARWRRTRLASFLS
ncbi:MAG: hypothetical protein ACKVP3_20860 [Hyphomicrobiaceae bacterium]